MLTILLFLLSFNLFGQVDGSITTVYDRDGEIRVLNVGATVLGANLNFTASSSWILSKGTCTAFNFSPTTGNAGTISVRAMPDTLPTTSISSGQQDASGTCSGTISGTAFSISWRVRRANGGFVTNFNGQFDSDWPVGCSASNANHLYKYACPATTAYPPQDGVALPADGSTVIDPIYGGIGLRIGGLSAQPYGTYSFSRDEDYYISPGGIRRVSDGVVIASLPGAGVCGGYSVMWWNKHKLSTGLDGFCHYASVPFTVKAWHLNVGGGTVVDDGVIFTHTHNLADHGGTGSTISNDGWAVFPDTNNKICVVNYRAVSPVATRVCADIKVGGLVRHVQISPTIDSRGIFAVEYGDDGLRGGGAVSEYVGYSFNPIAGTLTMDSQIAAPDRDWIFGDNWNYLSGYQCTPGPTCMRYGHTNLWTMGGSHYVFGNFLQYQSNSYMYGFQGCSLSNGLDGCYPVELGGGALSRMVTHAGEYVVCANKSPVCVGGAYGNEERVKLVTATESGGTCTGTISGNPYVTNDRVLFNKFSVSGWNGYKTIASSSGSTITWACTGSGTSLVGYSVIATPYNIAGSPNPNLWHVAASRADNGHTRVLWKYNGTSPADGDAYLDAVLPQVSTYGTYAKINDSYGYPEQGGIFILQTGFEGCNENTRPNDFCGSGGLKIIPTSTTSVLAVVTSKYAPGSCTLQWGQTNDFNTWPQQVLSGGALIRTHSITALTGGQLYKARVWCDGTHRGTVKTNWDYALDTWVQPSSFDTSNVDVMFTGVPAPTNTNDMVLTYGTSNPPVSTSTVSCSATNRCNVIVNLQKGVLQYWKLTWRDSGTNILRETPINRRLVN